MDSSWSPPRRNVVSGALLGVGAMAAIDEVVFHQLLRWHHFYDRSTPDIGLVSDGLLHAGSWMATVVGLFLLAGLRRDGVLAPRRWWAAVLLGSGGFQVFDGLVNHKLLRVHQIRYDVENLAVYDWVWNLGGAVLIVVGLLLRRSAHRDAVPARE